MVKENNREYETLDDILPETLGLKVLFVAKTPSPVSVKARHYFQGRQGRMFWNKLLNYGILTSMTKFEDDSLLDNGFGITDVVKKPRTYGNEPSVGEYRQGFDRILDLVAKHSPLVVVFVTKQNEYRTQLMDVQAAIDAAQPQKSDFYDDGCRILELSKRLYPLYVQQSLGEKAKMLRILASNYTMTGTTVSATYRKPFDFFANLPPRPIRLPRLDALRTIRFEVYMP